MTLENLFIFLCEKGRKPFGRFDKLMGYGQSDSRKIFQFGVLGEYKYYLRDMVSIESGLWQYCVENGMLDGVDRWTLNARQRSIYDKYITSEKMYTPKLNYEYRVIESSLKDESELESFLLNNIKVDKKYTEEEQELIDLDYGTGYTKKFVK